MDSLKTVFGILFSIITQVDYQHFNLCKSSDQRNEASKTKAKPLPKILDDKNHKIQDFFFTLFLCLYTVILNI